MIQLFALGDVPRLADLDVTELLAPLAVAAGDDLHRTLSHRVEAAARNLVMFFSEPDSATIHKYNVDYRAELGRLAADPARALGISPLDGGAARARDLALRVAQRSNHDPDTRVGAAAIGDVSAALLKSDKPGRVDAALSTGEAQLFDDLCECLFAVAPATLDALPSNELGGERHAAIRFAETFIQLVVDRARPRLAEPSTRVSYRLDALLKKQDRALLDGIRRERKFHRQHSHWLEDKGR